MSVGGDGFEIVGDVVMRGAMECAAAGIDELDVLHLGGVGGTLKHHVLEEMRETAAALRLEAKANFVVDADGNDRSGGVGRDDYLQSVRERGAFYGDFQMHSPGGLISTAFPVPC